MGSKTVNEMLFAPEVQDVFWRQMEPDARACLDMLERKETWTYQYSEMPELFTKTAEALPVIAQVPVEKKNQSVLEQLIPLLATMPLRQCVFAIHWLNEQAGESPIGWGSLCYLESLNIKNNKPEHEFSDYARVVVDRVSTVMTVRKALGLYGQWPLKANT